MSRPQEAMKVAVEDDEENSEEALFVSADRQGEDKVSEGGT